MFYGSEVRDYGKRLQVIVLRGGFLRSRENNETATSLEGKTITILL